MVEHDELGASSVEYGLLIAGIATLIVTIVFVFGGMINDTLFGVSCDTISGKVSTTTAVDPDCP